MTQNNEREAFEKWLKENYPDYPPPLSEVWQAAQQQSDGEIADLKNSLQKIVEVLAAGADLNESYRKTIAEYEKAHKAALEEKSQAMHDEELAYKHYHELKADNERLREALENVREASPKTQFHVYLSQVCDRALSSTPEQSLAEHDNDVIERIATALENAEGEFKTLPEYVALVRVMKNE